MKKASALARTPNECEAACPKGISVANIARMNRDYWSAKIFG